MSEARRRLLISRAIADVAAAQNSILVALGEELGLYRLLRDRGAMAANALAEAAGIARSFAQHWLVAQAASGYVDFDRASGAYRLNEEQEALLARDDDPIFMGAAFQLAAGLAEARSAIGAAARGGAPFSPGQAITDAITRSSRVKFPPLVVRHAEENQLLAQLENGEAVLEVGCGDAAALIALAVRFPKSTFTGIDTDDKAIARATEKVRGMDLSRRVRVRCCGPEALEAESFALALSLEMLHETSEPRALARSVRRALKSEGVWLTVEPCGAEDASENLTVEGRFLASLACLYCLPVSGFGAGVLGPLTSPSTYQRIASDAGFSRVRLKREGPLHVVISAEGI